MSNTLPILDNLRYSTDSKLWLQRSLISLNVCTSEREKLSRSFHSFNILILRSTKNLPLFNKTLLLEKNLLPWKKRTGRAFQSNPPRKKKKVGKFSGTRWLQLQQGGMVSSSNTGYRPLTVDVTTVINPFKERLAAFNGRQHAVTWPNNP